MCQMILDGEIDQFTRYVVPFRLPLISVELLDSNLKRIAVSSLFSYYPSESWLYVCSLSFFHIFMFVAELQ